jgi:lipopolysaccharide assembly outer membrane protein LptD (OstA)
MVGFSNRLLGTLPVIILIALISHQATAFAATSQQTDKATKKEKKKEKKAAREPDPQPAKQEQTDKSDPTKSEQSNGDGEEVTIESDRRSKTGDVWVAEGYVNVTLGDLRLQADYVTYNDATNDMVAEGNVIFDQGSDQRVTARRAEINWNTRRGVFWDTTGFTNRTQTGDYLFFNAARIEKTGPDTYELYDASITACEDTIPKWSFSARRAELKVDDRMKLHNSVFRIKSLPVFVLPYAWIPTTKSERKSGLLLPNTGSSNQKGRTVKTAYYQTLGQSADITFRNDLYTARGIGLGAEFRAQTDEKSFMKLGVFTVKDRLFGEPGENQGGTAFVGEGVQYLPRGWLAVGNVSLVTSLRFRQVFSDDISQVIDPRRESTFYANNNTGNVSVSFLAANETTTLFRPSADSLADAPPALGTNFDIKIRQAPQLDLTVYPRRIKEGLPVYFSFDSSTGALKREETADGEIVLVTPAAVQRLDFQPKVTIPLATIAGIAITPSLSLRETFYTNSIDTGVPRFDPDLFALSPTDSRLDPSSPQYEPGVGLFDRNAFDAISARSLSRHYAELAVDIRPPALEKDFLNKDGSRRFKHLIEPYVTYRLIKGIGEEFEKIIRFDERDAVANTNEFEYQIVNRFFTTRASSDFTRKKKKAQRRDGQTDQMETAQPDKRDKRDKREKKKDRDPQTESAVSDPKSEKPDKARLEKGEQAELAGERADAAGKREAQTDKPRDPDEASDEDPAAEATNLDAPVQPYEFLTVKVAQKYFFDRDFGGALVASRRNQFYPINTFSGFTFGGKERSFSPVNLQVRYRPLSLIYADLRMDIGKDDKAVRNLTVGAGVGTDKVTVTANYNLSRRIDIAPNRFEAGTFPGNQLTTNVQFGDGLRGLYGGARISYDFTDRIITDSELSKGRLRNSRSFVGYQWDCCGVQFNYNTFKAGLRNESAFSFTFTLAGLGSFGTDQFSELGGGQGGRKRGKKLRRAFDDNY